MAAQRTAPDKDEATVSRSEDSLNVFLNGFTARDLAVSLPSFDDTVSLQTVRETMRLRQLEVIGVRSTGEIAGWLGQDDVIGNGKLNTFRLFEPSSMIVDTAPLNEVIQRLNKEAYLFVRSFGKVSGVIVRHDLESPPMRMWLFGLVTISDLRVTQVIEECCPNGAWQEYLSEGRLRLAASLQDKRRRRGQNPNLLDCLQLCDKGQIVARNEMLRARTRFPSRRAVEIFVEALQDLRNNLAHSQDISGDWNVIHELAVNLHHIVLGMPSVASDERS